nr:PREDICTED: uncharacterized protein LOC109624869 [Paralichthys olivaceus]
METVNTISDGLGADFSSFVHVDLDDVENNNNISGGENCVSASTQALFQNDEDGEDERDNDDSGTDNSDIENSGTTLQRREHHGGEASSLPDTFQTSHLLFYERFKAYQDYMLGDCKPSEVKAFTADYLEKVVEPCDWLALWSTDVFDVLLEFADDTAAVGRISNNHESGYRQEVEQLEGWSRENNLCINVKKMKKMSVDFRKSRHPSLSPGTSEEQQWKWSPATDTWACT